MVIPGRAGSAYGPGHSTHEHLVMVGSPLLTPTDVRNMTPVIKAIRTNPEVLAVHKDPLAKMAVRIDVGGGVEEVSSKLMVCGWGVRVVE